MNSVIIKSKSVFLIVSLLLVASCGLLDDDDDPVQPPSVTYSETTLNATFFQAGNSLAPEINWNGNQGSLSIATPVTGLSVNTTTGVLSWTKDLPLGIYNVEVVVANSAGQIIVNFTLSNPLQGLFTGTLTVSAGTGPFELEFYPDGNLTGSWLGSTFTGTWTRNESTIEVNYTYDESGNLVSLKGTLENGVQPVYKGEWYFGHNQASSSQGPFEVMLN